MSQMLCNDFDTVLDPAIMISSIHGTIVGMCEVGAAGTTSPVLMLQIVVSHFFEARGEKAVKLTLASARF